MTNSEARKRMQARSGPESPLPGPQTANLGDGANGRLSEAERDALAQAFVRVAWLDINVDPPEWAAFGNDALDALAPVVERIVRTHAERAWDEGMSAEYDFESGYGDDFPTNPYRAARQEQDR